MTTSPPNITTNWPWLSNADLTGRWLTKKYNEKKRTQIASKMAEAENAAVAQLNGGWEGDDRFRDKSSLYSPLAARK